MGLRRSGQQDRNQEEPGPERQGHEEGYQGLREEAEGWQEEEDLDGRGDVGDRGQAERAQGGAQGIGVGGRRIEQLEVQQSLAAQIQSSAWLSMAQHRQMDCLSGIAASKTKPLWALRERRDLYRSSCLCAASTFGADLAHGHTSVGVDKMPWVTETSQPLGCTRIGMLVRRCSLMPSC